MTSIPTIVYMILSRDTQLSTSLFIGLVNTKLLVKYGRFSDVLKLIPGHTMILKNLQH